MSKKPAASPKKQDKSKQSLPQPESPKLADNQKDINNSPYSRSPQQERDNRSPVNHEPASESPLNQRSFENQSPNNFEGSRHADSINEEEQIPTDKDDLIEFLKLKLLKTQNSINDAFGVFLEEKQMTSKLVTEFDAKRREFNNVQKEVNRPIREKIHEKIEKTLEKAIDEKVEAENKRNELRRMITEKEMMRGELAFTLRLLQGENADKEKELETLLAKNNEFEVLIKELSQTKTDYDEQGVQKTNEIARLRGEREDMRGVMRKLTDVKHVLNRLFSNPELLYTREGTLEGLSKELVQTRKKPLAPVITQGVTSTSKLLPVQTNKPKYMVNEDDFWYADNPLEDYARDYGGREKNYNEKYNYNVKMQNKQLNNENLELDQPRYSSPTNVLPQISGAKPQPQNSYKKQSSNA